MGRPRRAASKHVRFDNASSAAPSASHYVGYVEEDETPEMIMAKFEQLERIQKEAEEAKRARAEQKAAEGGEGGGPDGEGAGAEREGAGDDAENDDFDEEMLLRVFKETSQFSVKSVLADNDMWGADFGDGYDEDGAAFFDDGDGVQGMDADFWDEVFGGSKRKRRGAGVPREKKPRAPAKPPRQHMITAYNSDNQMLMRKKKVIDPRAPNLLKLPPHPIPVSWGRVVAPYRPAEVMEAERNALPDCVHVTAPILGTDLTAYGTDFLAVHVNPPWDIEGSPDRGSVTVEQIGTIPFQKLTPYGFVFMWVEKENLSAVCDVMSKKQFVYVENMTWVHMRPDNVIVNSHAKYFARSHRTLLMFRRDVRQFPQGKDIELRHQRSADVTMDVVLTTSTGRRTIPSHVYKAVETLLPQAYKAGHKGKLLELWSEPGSAARRAGWTVVTDAAE